MEEKNFYQKVTELQNKVRVPKNLFNSFGNYSYRNAETIMESVKPILMEVGLTLTMTDDVIAVGNRVYVKATATLTDGKEVMRVSALAREEETKKGNSEAQITGSSSSYARKYCLSGLLLLDDNKDPDTEEYQKKKSDSVEEMILKLTEDRIDPSFVCELYKIKSLNDMTEKQALNMREHYQELKNKFEESKKK